MKRYVSRCTDNFKQKASYNIKTKRTSYLMCVLSRNNICFPFLFSFFVSFEISPVARKVTKHNVYREVMEDQNSYTITATATATFITNTHYYLLVKVTKSVYCLFVCRR